MSPIIDIMRPRETVCPFFEVDNTLDYVLVDFGDVEPYYMENADKKSVFHFGDNFNLLSIGVSMPLGFEHYSQVRDPGGNIFNTPYLILALITTSAPFTENEFVPNRYSLPFGNYELSINQYIYTSLQFQGTDYHVVIRPPKPGEQEIRISMLNVPDSLNGKTFPYIPFAKIEHSIELS